MTVPVKTSSTDEGHTPAKPDLVDKGKYNAWPKIVFSKQDLPILTSGVTHQAPTTQHDNSVLHVPGRPTLVDKGKYLSMSTGHPASSSNSTRSSGIVRREPIKQCNQRSPGPTHIAIIPHTHLARFFHASAAVHSLRHHSEKHSGGLLPDKNELSRQIREKAKSNIDQFINHFSRGSDHGHKYCVNLLQAQQAYQAASIDDMEVAKVAERWRKIFVGLEYAGDAAQVYLAFVGLYPGSKLATEPALVRFFTTNWGGLVFASATDIRKYYQEYNHDLGHFVIAEMADIGLALLGTDKVDDEINKFIAPYLKMKLAQTSIHLSRKMLNGCETGSGRLYKLILSPAAHVIQGLESSKGVVTSLTFALDHPFFWSPKDHWVEWASDKCHEQRLRQRSNLSHL